MAKSIRSKRMKRLRTQKRKTWVKEANDAHLKTSLANLKASLHKQPEPSRSLLGLRSALAAAAPKHSVSVDDDVEVGAGAVVAAAQAAAATVNEEVDMEVDSKGKTDKEQRQARRKRRSKRRGFKLHRVGKKK